MKKRPESILNPRSLRRYWPPILLFIHLTFVAQHLVGQADVRQPIQRRHLPIETNVFVTNRPVPFALKPVPAPRYYDGTSAPPNFTNLFKPPSFTNLGQWDPIEMGFRMSIARKETMLGDTNLSPSLRTALEDMIKSDQKRLSDHQTNGQRRPLRLPASFTNQ